MTYYEVVKQMSQEEMTAVFYRFIFPFIEDAEPEQKIMAWNDIKTLLNSEVGDFG